MVCLLKKAGHTPSGEDVTAGWGLKKAVAARMRLVMFNGSTETVIRLSALETGFLVMPRPSENHQHH